MSRPLSKWNKEMLIEECHKLKISHAGTNKELVKRIQQHREAISNLFDENSRNMVREEVLKYGVPDVTSLVEDQEAMLTSDLGGDAATASFYIQVNRANLSMYFINGLLYPNNLEESKIYREENRQEDMLTKYPDYLVLSKGYIDQITEDQVMIEVVLSPGQTQELDTNQEVLFLSYPLPISRVKALYFASESSKGSFLATIDIFPDTFVPSEICKLLPDNIRQVFLHNTPLPPNQSIHIDQWASRMRHYNKLMGLFAFIKNSRLFYTNKTGEFASYSDKYFEALFLINPALSARDHFQEISRESFFKWMIFPAELSTQNSVQRILFSKIIDCIYKDSLFTTELSIGLLQASLEESSQVERQQWGGILQIFQQYRQRRIDYRSVIDYLVSRVKQGLPFIILILLTKFSNKSISHTDKQAVRNYFASPDNRIDSIQIDYILAVLGLYYGYNTMVKSELNLRLTDPLFSQLAHEHTNIKFKLDSYFDRVIIESIYQFCVHDYSKAEQSYEYLKNLPTRQQSDLALPSGTYIDHSYEVLGKKILSIIKSNPYTGIETILEKYPSTIPLHNKQLFDFILQKTPELMCVDKQKLLAWIRQAPVTSEDLDKLKWILNRSL